jgi:toxin ParE1/3/4
VTRGVRFHPLATAEVVDAYRWYEQRLDGLGGRFLDAVRATTARVSRWPNSGTPTRHDGSGLVLERRIGVNGFPYVVVFRDARAELEVLAVHHERRRPFHWAERAE